MTEERRNGDLVNGNLVNGDLVNGDLGDGMFSLLFRRRLDFDESSRQRRDISPLELEMYKRAIRRELLDRRRHAATCATLLCILVCGSLMVSLGVALTCTGLLVPRLRVNATPWLVTGPTCIVVGVLILLLSVEICMKKKKVAIDDLGVGKKKSSEESNFKVKSLPIWRGMDRAENKDSQGSSNKVGCVQQDPVKLSYPSLASTSTDLLLDPAKLESCLANTAKPS